MATANQAVTHSLSQSAAQLARVPSVPRRRVVQPVSHKRAAVVLRRGMRPLEFRQVEEQMELLGLVSLPVLPGQRKMHVTSTPVCGLIVTGSAFEASLIERAMIEEAVRHAHSVGAPILALSDAAPLVLDALDMKLAEAAPGVGLLVHTEDQVIATSAHIGRALKVMAKSPEVS